MSKIHGYTTLLAPEATKLPYLETLLSWSKICDTLSICYSTFPDLGVAPPRGAVAPWQDDKSRTILEEFNKQVLDGKIKIVDHIWDPNEPREDGFTKQLARELAHTQAQGDQDAWLAHFDADEILRDSEAAKVLDAVDQDNSETNLMARRPFIITGILELFGGSDKVRFNFGNWLKIRLTRNMPELIHGLPLRIMNMPVRGRNPRTGKIISLENRDDGAGFISRLSLSRPDYRFGIWLTDVEVINEIISLRAAPQDSPAWQRAILGLQNSLDSDVWIYHTSWIDIPRKWRMGWFFDNFWAVLNGKQDTFTEKLDKSGTFTHTRAPEGDELITDLQREMNRPEIKTLNVSAPYVFADVAKWREKAGLPNRVPGINYGEFGI